MKKYFYNYLSIIGAIFLILFVLITGGVLLTRAGLVSNDSVISLDRAVGQGGMMVKSSPLMAEVAPSSAPIAGDVSSVAIPRKITKSGNLSLLVPTAESAVTQIQALATQVGGYISNSNIYETSPGIKSGLVTLRVPTDKFEATISALKQLAVKVESESVNADDVTEQFIDVTARLSTLRAEETQYLAIMKKAQKVEDILNVTNRLTEVRSQIESLQSQLKYLNSQVDLSTITVNLTAEKDVTILGIHWQPLTVIKQALRSLLESLVSYVNLIIAFVVFLPVLALWLITIGFVVWLIWQLVKRIKKTGRVIEIKKVEKIGKKTKKLTP